MKFLNNNILIIILGICISGCVSNNTPSSLSKQDIPCTKVSGNNYIKNKIKKEKEKLNEINEIILKKGYPDFYCSSSVVSKFIFFDTSMVYSAFISYDQTFATIEKNHYKLSKKFIPTNIYKLLEENESKTNPDLNIKYLNDGLITGTYEGNLDNVKFFIEKGADLNFKDALGKTALMIAINNDHKKIINHLIKKDINTNIKDDYGKTVLFYALRKNDNELVALLLKKGARIDIQSNSGLRPFELALKKENIYAINKFTEIMGINNTNKKFAYTAINDYKKIELQKQQIELIKQQIKNQQDDEKKREYRESIQMLHNTINNINSTNQKAIEGLNKQYNSEPKKKYYYIHKLSPNLYHIK